MPLRRTPRTLLAVPVSLALLGLAPGGSQAPTPPAEDALLRLLVARTGAPAAALLAQEETDAHYAEAQLAPPTAQAAAESRSATRSTTEATDPATGPSRATATSTVPLARIANSTGTGTSTSTAATSATTNAADTETSTGTVAQSRTQSRTQPQTQPETDTAPTSPAVQTGQAIRPADHFRAGSITKTFIATVVLQLAAEHRLSLSDSVDDHLPGLVRGPGADGRDITLRQLLTHTSGLADFTTVTQGAVPLTPRQAVRIALHLPPGHRGRFAYSSTNYVVLGMVIQQVTGDSYATEAERRIINPLHLTGTSFPGTRTTLPSPHGRAYSADGSDVTELDPRVAGAAGELVTTLADLDRFYAALLGGGLLPSHWLHEMLDTRTAHGSYGMGIYPTKLPCGTTVWGHNGRISGSYVRTAATLDGRRVLTYRADTDAVNAPGLERDLLSAEFCPRTS
ncbi:Serine-type D-Ala-D-Ala carboxypeptidase [Actinobacteria bacterium OK074]|nr:Serine-type D-Ala-D-Ala carboxypeptidase [Actinobacteria bacterium OK074]